MASVTVEVKGLQELGAAMRDLALKVNLQICGRATNAAAQVVKTQAKRNIEASPSVDTGSLDAAVIVKKLGRSQLADLTAAHIVTVRGRGKVIKKTGLRQASAPYAHMVEFGTVRMAAEPFLRPAFDSTHNAQVEAMAQKLKEGIDKATK